MEYIQKIPNWIRWCLIPVSSAFTLLLVTIIANIVGKLLVFFGGDRGFDEKFYSYLLSPLLAGFCSVYVAMMFAPTRKIGTGIFMSSLWCAAYGALAFFSVVSSQFVVLIPVVAGCVGSIYALYVFDDY
jgi:hypothetical protein